MKSKRKKVQFANIFYFHAKLLDLEKKKVSISINTMLIVHLFYLQLNLFVCSLKRFALKPISFSCTIKTQKSLHTPRAFSLWTSLFCFTPNWSSVKHCKAQRLTMSHTNLLECNGQTVLNTFYGLFTRWICEIMQFKGFRKYFIWCGRLLLYAVRNN